jgi:hypothetical protein
MSFRIRLLLSLGLLLGIAMLPGAAQAQQTITCESNNGSRKYCGTPNPGQVSLSRQISGASCVQGQSWGVDNQGLWVDKGCRAEFTVGGYGGQGAGSSITCESNDGNRKYCGMVDSRAPVSIQRQISGASCVQGQSWGVDNQGLWVDRGCRATFTIGGYNNNGYNGGGYNGGGYNGGPGATITCESNDGNRKYCGDASVGQATLSRQISGSPCVQGTSWGVDTRGLWVDKGCRAEFTTGGNGWNGGNGGNSNWNGGNWNNYTPITNYPHVKADTSGRGNFNSQMLGAGDVTRGYIDTKSGRAMVGVSGSSGLRVMFYGDVVQAQDRRIVIRITSSDRGQAQGKADIYLNGDKNEIESISINGANFNGDFNRK